MTSVGEETVLALKKALVEGKNAWWHAAEDGLEVLKLRDGDDIAGGAKVAAGDFRQVIEELLNCLHGRLLERER